MLMEKERYTKSNLIDSGIITTKQTKDNVLYYIFKDEEIVYVGITNDYKYRKSQHFQLVKNESDRAYNKVLYRAMRKYGMNRFSMYIFHQGDNRNEMAEKEIEWIEKLSSIGLCRYNIVNHMSGERGLVNRDNSARKYDKNITGVKDRIMHIEKFLSDEQNTIQGSLNSHERTANYILESKDIESIRNIEYSFYIDKYDFEIGGKKYEFVPCSKIKYEEKIPISYDEFYGMPMHERMNIISSYVQENMYDREYNDGDLPYDLDEDIYENIFEHVQLGYEDSRALIMDMVVGADLPYTERWEEEVLDLINFMPDFVKAYTLQVVKDVFSGEVVCWQNPKRKKSA